MITFLNETNYDYFSKLGRQQRFEEDDYDDLSGWSSLLKIIEFYRISRDCMVQCPNLGKKHGCPHWQTCQWCHFEHILDHPLRKKHEKNLSVFDIAGWLVVDKTPLTMTIMSFSLWTEQISRMLEMVEL